MPSKKELSNLKKGKRDWCNKFYSRHKPVFMAMAMRDYSCSEEDAENIYHDAFYKLIRHIGRKKLTVLTCSLKTYLWKIGINLLINYAEKNDRFAARFEEALFVEEPADDYDPEDALKRERKIELIKEIIARLPKEERKMIRLCFFTDHDMESIAGEMGYKNEAVARQKKHKLIKKLKRLVKKALEGEI
jgi:RNA polymerase sigma factor (sigma-70 family)